MKYTFPLETKYRQTFDFIKSGEKRIETRAGGPKYENIVVGDTVIIECGGDTFERVVRKVQKFESIDKMLEVYKPEDINPLVTTAEELKAKYLLFPGYPERLAQFGIMAFEFETEK